MDVPVSKRALVAGAWVLAVAVVLVVCLPPRWVAATDSTDARQRASKRAEGGTALLWRGGSDPRVAESRRALAAELSDPAAQDAAASSAPESTQPTQVTPVVVELPTDDFDERSRLSSWFGGNSFGFDLFGHIGQRAPSNPVDGRFVAPHPDGGLAVEGVYENGEREGEWASYYPDGSLRIDGQYGDGKREGRWKAYHPSGQLMGEGEYSGGLREGTWVLYYSNGLVKEQGVFEHDLRHGPWQYYDGFGQLEARSGFYRYGRML